MKLLRYRVTNFRSVGDSGWIDVNKVTALIGVNESGKSNLLLPLWKLKPARDGEIDPTSDYPKTMFGEIRESPDEHRFIEAEFHTGKMATELARLADIPAESAHVVSVSRYFDGAYRIDFPNHVRRTAVDGEWLVNEVSTCADAVEESKALKQEVELQKDVANGLRKIAEDRRDQEKINAAGLRETRLSVKSLLPDEPAKTSVIVPLVQQLEERLGEALADITRPDPGDKEGVIEKIVSAVPPFVYYSNYNNLDSEIYLPHVVNNLARDDLGSKESAKARTLRVLFSFVRLQPDEILELGRDFRDPNGQAREPKPEEIKEIAEKKRMRSILLQSAGTTITEKFRSWWKQGDYRFRFEADGNHFRIWVADDRRPTEVELENRSTGLQWFLSFYLVFLVWSAP